VRLSHAAVCDVRRAVDLPQTSVQDASATPAGCDIYFRCGGIFSDNVTTNFLLILTVKYFLKSVNV